jgi:type IV pilus assembly protein PilY1
MFFRNSARRKKEKTMKKSCLCVSIITCLLLGAASTFGMNCEAPPFINRAVTPNVLIVMDHSGSMRGGLPEPNEDQWFPYDANKTYTPWVGMPDKGSNYNNYEWYHRNRWCVAKHVITHFLNDTEGLRFGLMRMDGAGDGEGGYWWGEGDWGIPNPADLPYATWEGQHKDAPPWQQFSLPKRFRHGGKLLRPVGTDKNALINYINGWEIYKTVPHTYTILAETLYTAAQYFAEGHGPAGMTTYKSDASITDWQYGSYWASKTDDYGNAIDTSSPITDWCQKNFVIFMTDGLSNFDSDWDEMLNVVGDYDGDGRDDPHHDGGDEGENHNYFDDVAQWMYETDLRNDMPNKEEWVNGVKKTVMQNVTTYVIGFTIDKPLLKQAAEQGGGKYFTANDYESLRAAFENVKNDIVGQVASASAVAVQSTSTEGQRRLLRAKFVPTDWVGNLEAFGLPYTPGDQPIWDSGIKLRDKNPVDRYIFTAMDSKSGPAIEMNTKVFFTETNSTTIDADNNKLSDLLGAVDDAEAKKIIGYIRGSHVDGYRLRKGGLKLGDIAYSSPVISGNMVYVGANDGMLHAFDINTGEEKWAFIPNNLLGKLKDLTLPEYCHEYFVDLSPKVAQISAGGLMKKVLVGGERGGGNAFFALDITDAQDPALVQPMWEFRDKYLGQSWTVPAVARTWLGGAERWVAFIGSAQGNKDTKGYLFAVDVATGEKMGTELLLTGAPENQLPSLRAIDFDQDGYADRVFVGCITEKLFVVEVGANADPKSWKSNHILSTDPGQPISVSTSLSLYKEEGQTHVVAYFGTGKYYTLADKSDLTLQSFYAVKDNAVKVGKGGLANQTNPGNCADILGGFGWYIDLVEGPGERVVSSSLVIGGYVFFTTFQPSDDPCEAGGIARLYCVNYDNGCVPAAPVFDYNRDGVVDEGDMVGGAVPRTIVIGHGVPSDIVFDPSESTIIIQTSDTTIHQFKVDVLSKRLTVHSWREVID